MADNIPNLYTPNLSGVDPRSARIIRDLVERMNYLTMELDRVRGVAESASPGVDAAKKENPKAGIITIPATGGDGQSGLVRVNKDGVIVSYVNPSGIVPYQRNLFLDYTTTTTVVNTTTETSLLGPGDDGSTKVIDPSLVKVGRTFRLRFQGQFTYVAATTPTIDLRLKLGTVTFVTYTPLPVLMTGTGSEWFIDAYFTITALGTSGTGAMQVSELLWQASSNGAQGTSLASGRAKTSQTIDWTVPQTWVLTMQWGTANANNSLFYNFGCIDIIR